MARPAWSPDAETRKRVRDMIAYGYPQAVVAKRVGCDAKTLLRRCKDEVTNGRQDLEIELHGWVIGSILQRTEQLEARLVQRPGEEEPTVVTNLITDDRARVSLFQFWAARNLGWTEPASEVKAKVQAEVAVEFKPRDLAAADAARQRAYEFLAELAKRVADRAQREAPGPGDAGVPPVAPTG